jgi:hypothetical protein
MHEFFGGDCRSHLKGPSYEKAGKLPSNSDKDSYGEIISIEDVNRRHDHHDRLVAVYVWVHTIRGMQIPDLTLNSLYFCHKRDTN